MKKLLLISLSLALSGCASAKKTTDFSAVNKPVTVVENTTKAEVIAQVKNTVDSSLKQVYNEVWPWIVLVLGLAVIFVIGLPCGLLIVVWLGKKWITSNSYVGQFQKIKELKGLS